MKGVCDCGIWVRVKGGYGRWKVGMRGGRWVWEVKGGYGT